MKPFTFISVNHLPKEGVDDIPNKLFPFIWFFLRQAKFPFFLGALIFGIAALCQALTPLFLREIVNLLTLENSLSDITQIGWLMVAMVVIGYGGYHFFWSLGNYVSGPSFHSHFREMIRSQLFNYLSKHSTTYFQNDFAGRLANKIDVAGHGIAAIIDDFHYIVWTSIVGIIVVSFIFLNLDITMLAVFIVWLIAYASFCVYFIPKTGPKSALTADTHSKLVGALVDIIGNISIVKLFARNQHEREKVNEFAVDAAEACRDLYVFWFQFRAFLGLFAIILAGAISALALNGYNEGWLNAGDVILALTALPIVLSNTWILATNAGNFAQYLGAIRDAMSTIIQPRELQDSSGANKLKIPSNKASISFNNVDFHYGKGAGVIDNLNLKIPAGQKVGLIGKSGVGKSTLVNLLLRFYDVEGGQININGQNISQITQESLRHHIAMVTQEPSLFHRSIIDNIRYGKPEATENEVIAAAKRAHAHDFILDLQDKDGRTSYAAHVGERGVKLSGGQRQRVAIARVILANAPILILDEATSALDSQVESAIQEEMKTLMQGKTVIAIAHRLSTIRQLDRLIVLDNGKIIEDGSHEELLKLNKHYAKLWNMQSGGFIGE